jgi:hypothetical protein
MVAISYSFEALKAVLKVVVNSEPVFTLNVDASELEYTSLDNAVNIMFSGWWSNSFCNLSRNWNISSTASFRLFL